MNFLVRRVRGLNRGSLPTVALLLALLGLAADAWAADPVFDARGFNRNREFYGELPFEHVDPLNGNLLLTFTDLVLPGNAGFDLKIQRTYNSKVYRQLTPTLDFDDSWAGIGWTLHMGRVLNPYDSTPDPPIIEMPDGSRHQTYRHVDGSDTFISRDFWVYKRNNKTLKLPNGVVYEFNHPGNIGEGDALYATRIVDSFGNEVHITYRTQPSDSIQEIEQRLGTRTRSITFGVPTSPGFALRTMSFNGKTWNYVQTASNEAGKTFLVDARPPVCGATGACASWRHEYTAPGFHELTKVTTPSGGTISYAYNTVTFQIGQPFSVPSRAVVTRTTGGSVPGGSWQYQYGQGSGADETVVTGPCSSTRYRHHGVGNFSTLGEAWRVGLLARKEIRATNGALMEATDFTWRTPNAADRISNDTETIGHNQSAAIYVPLVQQRTVTRGQSSWRTQHTYHASGSGSPFNDYGRPFQTDEDGELDRRTVRVFQYGFAPYIVDRVQSETVSVGPQSFARSNGYTLANGFLTSTTVYGITTRFRPSSDGRGNVREIEDGNSKKTTFTYDYGLANSIRTPEFRVDRVISPDGTITSETRRGFTTRYVYDGLLRTREIQPHLGNKAIFTYDNANGQTITRTRGASSVTTTLDGFGRTTFTVNSLQVKVRNAYDACGRTIREGYPFKTGEGAGDIGVGVLYDALDRVTRRTNPDNTFVQYGYPNGIDVQITDENSRVTDQDWSTFGDPANARLMSVLDAGSGTSGARQLTSYAYNGIGKLTSVSQPGVQRTWTYLTGTDRLDSESHPESGVIDYTVYDGAGNLKEKVEDGHGTIKLSYDGNNRLTGINYPGSADDVVFDYDDSDNRTLVSNPSARSDLSYDGNNRLDWREDTVGGRKFKTDYGYDANDNLTLLDYPSGSRVGYAYNNEGQITTVTNGGTTNYARTFQYHPSGAVRSFIAGNNITHVTTFHGTRYWVTRMQSGAPLDVQYNDHDNVGNPTSMFDARLGGNLSLTYDDVDRLKTATGAWGLARYDYDATGNRMRYELGGGATTYTYQSNRLATATPPGGPTIHFGWDAAGNMTSDGVPGRTYTYTPANMVRELRNGTTLVASYRYDADNLRKLKRAGALTSYFIHGLGSQLLSELEQNGAGPVAVKRDYIYAGSRLIASVRPPTLVVEPAMLVFAGVAGGPQPPTLPLTIREAGGGSLSWQATDSATWLSLPAGGTSTPATVSVTANTTGLAVGLYTADVTVSSTGAAGSPRNVPVRLVVTNGPELVVQPSSLTFHMDAGGLNPAPQTAYVVSSGGQATWTATPSHSWIHVDPPEDETPGTITVSVDGSLAHAGTHQGWVRVEAALPGSPRYVPVSLVVHPPAGTDCTSNAWFCEPFDELDQGDVAGQGAWALEEGTLSSQVVDDPRGTGNVLAVEPPLGQQVNNLAVFPTPAPSINGTDITLQVMTLDVPDNSKQVAKIQLFTLEGQGWGKTGMEFGALRFGSALHFQWGPTVAQVLVDRLESGRWYQVRLAYQNGRVDAYVDGQLAFSTTNLVAGTLPVRKFGLTGWDYPGVGHLDLLEARPLPSGLVVEPLSLSFRTSAGGLQAVAAPAAEAPRAPRAAENWRGRLPITFEPNQGQAPPDVRFLTRGLGYAVSFAPSKVTLHTLAARGATPGSIGLTFLGGRRDIEARVAQPQPGTANYYIGNDPSKWVTGVPQYSQVVLPEVYPGVDVVFYGQAGLLEYDLVLKPGADPGRIRLSFDGLSEPRLDEAGDVVLRTAGGEVRQRRPFAYQLVDGARRMVDAEQRVEGQQVTFRVADYDHGEPLYIDPVIVFSTYLGDNAEPRDVGKAIAVDDDLNVWVAGLTPSLDFPTLNAYQDTLAGVTDAFVTKLNANGSALTFSTYLGGDETDEGLALALDAQGNGYVAGMTLSPTFPVLNPLPGTGFAHLGGRDGFVAKFTPTGTLLLSTYLGGKFDDRLTDVAVEKSSGAVYVAGEVLATPPDFKWDTDPDVVFRKVTTHPFGAAGDAYVARVIGGGFYMTYLNGWNQESAPRIAVDGANNVYVTGWTATPPEVNPQANPFPWSPGSYKSTFVGGPHTFVTKLDSSGAQAYSAFVSGDNGAQAKDIGLEPGCAAACAPYFAGITSSNSWPETARIGPGGQYDAFVGKLTPAGSALVYLTRIGAHFEDWANSVAVDASGRAHIAGLSTQDHLQHETLPVIPCVEKLTGPPSGFEAFVATLDAEGRRLDSCAAFGTIWHDEAHGIALDSIGDAYVTGLASRAGLPTTPNAFQQQGYEDAFVTKLTSSGGGDLTRMQFASTAYRSGEETGAGVVTVTRSGSLSGTATVNYRTTSGTATRNVDYVLTVGTLRFESLETARAFVVPIIDDTLSESDETILLSLSAPTGGVLGFPTSAVLTIGDDDHTSHQLSIRDRVLSSGPHWTASDDMDWLVLSDTEDDGPDIITASVNATGLVPGVYTGTIVVTGDTGDSPQVVQVTLTVTAQ